MNSKAKNIRRKHKKAKDRLAARRREGLALQAQLKSSRRRKKPAQTQTTEAAEVAKEILEGFTLNQNLLNGQQ